MIRKILLNILLAVCLAAGIGALGYAAYTIGSYIELYIEHNDKVGDRSIVHDERVLLRAEKAIDRFARYTAVYYKDSLFDVKMWEDGRTFDIAEDDKTYVVVNRLSVGDPSAIAGKLLEERNRAMENCEDIFKFPGYKRVVDESLELLYGYIRDSGILKEKETLIAELGKVTVMVGELDMAGRSFCTEDTIVVCINRGDVRKTVVIHELVHVLQHITRNGLDSRYPMFAEVMTDILTNAVYPNNNVFQLSAYRDYNPSVLNCVGVFREKAIEAFFYGHDVLHDVVPEDEWHLFLYTIEAEVRSPDSPYYENCYNRLISKWLDRMDRMD